MGLQAFVGGPVPEVVVAVVGSRKGASLDDVASFMHALYRKQPDTVIVSGGAAGVDKTAEHEWLGLGGKVISLRPVQKGESFWIDRWMLSNDARECEVETLRDVSFADFTSAAIYRDSLIVDYADKVVAFQADPPSAGTTITCGFAKQAGKPVHLYTPREPFAA